MRNKPVTERWTIAELAERVVTALAVNFDGVANGRVRDTPDLRAIRYYTTLGLLDRPAEMRGRTALYCRRHLWQLVAIKRLQANGLSLADVQQRLLGIGDRELEKLADVKLLDGEPTKRRRHVSPAQIPAERRDDFWNAVPARPAQREEPVPVPIGQPQMVTLVPLAAGMYVGVESERSMTQEDVEVLKKAAEPLRQLLIERRLVRPEREKS
jgi:DNA-binding transcriptional MerR regulator